MRFHGEKNGRQTATVSVNLTSWERKKNRKGDEAERGRRAEGKKEEEGVGKGEASKE